MTAQQSEPIINYQQSSHLRQHKLKNGRNQHYITLYYIHYIHYIIVLNTELLYLRYAQIHLHSLFPVLTEI